MPPRSCSARDTLSWPWTSHSLKPLSRVIFTSAIRSTLEVAEIGQLMGVGGRATERTINQAKRGMTVDGRARVVATQRKQWAELKREKHRGRLLANAC